MPAHLQQFLSTPSSSPSQSQSKATIRYKRPPVRPSIVATDIYVSRKSQFQPQLKRAMTLLFPTHQRPAKKKIRIRDILADRNLILAPSDSNIDIETREPFVDIHGSGMVIHKAVELALAIQERSGGEVVISRVNSSSQHAIDDISIESGDDIGEKTEVRNISTIHIRLCRKQIS